MKFVCLKRGRISVKFTPHLKQHFLYQKANEKLEQELDVVNLIRSIRKLKLMTKLLLAPRIRTLLKFSRRNLLESNSSSSDSDHHKYDVMKLLDSSNKLIKLSVMAKVKRHLKHYEDHHPDNSERDLLQSIFLRRPKDYIDDKTIRANS